MADKPRATLTEAELRIMRVLWASKEATVGDVVDALEKPRLARNTVQTMLGILERKGYAKHRAEGRTFVYRPRVDEKSVQDNVLHYMLAKFFDDSPQQLMVRLIGSERISKKDVDRIKQMFAREGAAE